MSIQESLNEARQRMGTYVADNRLQILARLDTAERFANEQTKGHYQDKIAKARGKTEHYLAKLQQPPG